MYLSAKPQMLAILAVCSLANFCSARVAPTSLDHDSLFRSGHVFADFGGIPEKREDKGQARILPLGASIMSGVGSSNGNGLRKPLRDALRFDGWDVNMVGSLHSGEMVDNDHEAVSGDIITQVHTRLKKSLGYKANIVIINAGTNDAIRNIEPANAGSRMNDLLNTIWDADGMADTCVMLSTLLDTTEATGRVTRITINAKYRELVQQRAGEGKCIYLADMDPEGAGHGWITWADYDQSETVHIHPGDEGHRKMAYVFYQAINQAAADGKIAPPATDFEASQPTCDKEYGNGVPAGGKTQRGSGEHDGIYMHSAEEMGIILTVESEWDRNQWRFARLFSRDYDDFVGWFEPEPGVHAFGVWKNSADGRGEFTKIDDMSTGMYCIPRGLVFIDMNADGLDDAVCVYPDGNLYLSINNGDGDRDAGKPPTFKFHDKIKENEGYTQDRVRLADIDGDGRADYGILDDGGNVHFWRNGWVDDVPEYWQPLGQRFDALGMGDINGVRFEDLNGDGRDDWMWMTEDGMTDTWTNTRSCKKGESGDGLNVAWRQAFHEGKTKDSQHWTHFGMMNYQNDDEMNLRTRIHFARVYGEPSAFGNLGKQDYIFLQHDKKNKKHRFRMRAWKNKGSGGTKVLADGNKYCNMVGHKNGMEDYVWTHSTGDMTLYINRGKETISDSDPGGFWDPMTGIIWTPPRDMHRRDLHLADWDGDGDCDIIYVDPAGGSVEVFINEYPERKKWEWTHLDNPAPDLHCNQEKGIGIHDLAVRFADLTGNGRADYMCLEPDGRVTGFVQHDDGGWENVGQIKFAEGKDRANLRWADVNGDGRDDMIWVDKFNGDGYVWYNGDRAKPEETSGSSFFWRKINEPVYQGNVAGTCMYYPDLDGNGRADMHGILGTWTNWANTWFNPSCGMTDAEGDDPGGVVDPQLPVRPTQPGDGGGNEPNEDDWRSITCTNEGVTDHTMYGPDRWRLVDADGAWASVVEGWQYNLTHGRFEKHFANNVSNFFNGPQDVYCEIFSDSNACQQLALNCENVNYPAGAFILRSFNNVFDMHNNLWEAVNDAVGANDIGGIASTFGAIPKEDPGIATSILIDIALTAWGLVMGPAWNKLIGPKFKDSTNAGTVKDTTNDLVKNSLTLTKDILNTRATDQLGVQNGLEAQMQALTQAWKDSVLATHQFIFGGSPEGYLQLGDMISDASMMGSTWLVDRNAHALEVKRAINSFLIPLAWAYSPDIIYPFIADSGVGCDEDPGWNHDASFTETEQHWLSDDAMSNGRYCHEGKSYWLLMGRDKGTSCDDSRGFTDCGDFASAQGYEALVKERYSGISVQNVVVGSLNSKKANGGKNGYKIDIEAPGKEVLQTFQDHGLEAPGIWGIPVCSMDEIQENYNGWFQGDNDGPNGNANFPCNA